MNKELGFIYVAGSRSLLNASRTLRRNFWKIGCTGNLESRFFTGAEAYNRCEPQQCWYPEAVWALSPFRASEWEIRRDLGAHLVFGPEADAFPALDHTEAVFDLKREVLISRISDMLGHAPLMRLNYSAFRSATDDDAESLRNLQRQMVDFHLESLVLQAA